MKYLGEDKNTLSIASTLLGKYDLIIFPWTLDDEINSFWKKLSLSELSNIQTFENNKNNLSPVKNQNSVVDNGNKDEFTKYINLRFNQSFVPIFLNIQDRELDIISRFLKIPFKPIPKEYIFDDLDDKFYGIKTTLLKNALTFNRFV